MIIDVAIPGDTRVCDKERKKTKKYSLLKDEIARLWQMKKVVVILIVTGVLETITTSLRSILKDLELRSKLNMFRNQHC